MLAGLSKTCKDLPTLYMGEGGIERKVYKLIFMIVVITIITLADSDSHLVISGLKLVIVMDMTVNHISGSAYSRRF